MRVEISLRETSQKLVYPNAANTYQKGDLFCVFVESENVVHKYPLCRIWRIEEEYKKK